MLSSTIKFEKNESKLPISPNALPVFCREGYLSSKGTDYGWIVSADFILPVLIDKRLIFRRMVFTCAPIRICDSRGDETIFMKEVISFIGEHKLCDFIAKAQSNVVFNSLPEKIDTVPWGTYKLSLTRTEDEIIAGYHKKHRNVIKKAEKSGAYVNLDERIDVIYNNIKETLDRQKSVYYPSLDFLQKLKDKLGSNLLLASVYQDDELQGTAVILFDNECGYYLYGGSAIRPATGCVNFLQHKIIMHLRDLGVSQYDFVGARINVQPGSKFEGIQRFKSRFGSDLEQGFAFNYVYSKFKYKLFNLVVKLYLSLKGVKYVDPIMELKRD